MTGHQQTIYTIHESQLNNSSNNNNTEANMNSGQRNSTDLLIDTSSIPMTQQQPMPPMQHQHQLQAQPAQQQQQQQGFQQQQQLDLQTITSQPARDNASAGSARVAPENQNVVYSVHPVFSLLDTHDTLLVRQRADCTSTCCGFESVNTYTVRSRDGQPLLKAIENSNCCERCCFEGNREYNLTLVHNEEVVARIRKPYRVSRFCCYSNSVKIESPEDNPIGSIRQLFTLFGHPRYAIYDCQQQAKQASFLLESISCKYCCTPFLCTCVCGNEKFKIISCESRAEVGIITRQWSQLSASNNNDTFSNQAEQQQADNNENVINQPFANGNPTSEGSLNDLNNASGALANQRSDQLFGIQFLDNANLEARQKVLLLSACFMMDFFYFENDRRRRKITSC